MPRSPRSRYFVVAAVAATLPCFVAATPASAVVSQWPGVPTAVHVTAVGQTSFAVAASPSANVTRYKLFASTVKADLYVSSLGLARSTRSVNTSTGPRITLAGLRYAALPYYYRFAATNGPRMRVSAIAAVSLHPATPAAVRLVTGSKGSYLLWTSGAATGFAIAQSTDPAMRLNRHDYLLRGQNAQFTPYGLHKGTRYYYRVRARNGASWSTYSAQVAGTALTSAQPVRVLTYNILANVFDGRQLTGEVIAPWNTGRKAAAAALVAQAGADVIALEEGGSWTNGYRSPLQADSLATALGTGYSIARTEIPAGQSGYSVRTGDYIIYRNSRYAAVGAGGHWSIGDGLYAAYQVLRNRTTGATFMMVVTHLRAGVSTAYDKLRESQTQAVITQARTIAAAHGNPPTVFAGDFNSYLSTYHPYDGPSRPTRAAHLGEAFYVAQSTANARYNSVNLYRRTPPQGLGSADRIFLDAGIAVHSWMQVLDLSNGRFPGVIPSDHNPVVADVEVPF